ncbi:MAG TPA: MFS transporter [Acidimicrobiales bacterium]|nr:MFS transporter [Acidimicrobiales bacterium]
MLNITGGESPFPLSILFLLFFFDEFDTGAFNVLAPNIKRSFHLTDRDFGLVVVLNLGIVLVLAIPAGHMGDRVKRVFFVVIGGVIAGTFSFLTGVVTTMGLLVVVRIMNGVGRLANDPIHTSLLTDYYEPFHRPRVFATHRNAQQLGAVFGSAIAGLAAYAVGWRVTFMVLLVPILVTAFAATRMREPDRGESDRRAAGGVLPHVTPLPFREAVRVLLQARTLRRAYWGVIIIGGGIVPLAVLLPLYLDRVFHLNEAARGFIVGGNALATFFGIQNAGKWTQGWLAQSLGEPVRKCAWLLILVGIELGLVAAAPNLWFFVPIGLITSFTTGIFLPPLLTVTALVSPARVRSLGFSFFSIFVVIGAAIFFASPLGSLSDTHGIRWGLASSAPFWFFAGVVIKSAAQFVTDDTQRAFASLDE